MLFRLCSKPDPCPVHSLLGVVHTTGELAQFFVGFLPNLVIVQLFSLLGVMHTTEELAQ